MTNSAPNQQVSIFDDLGFKNSIKILQENIRDLYLSFNAPWIIGYSGGKDSSTVLQLVWTSLEGLPKDQLKHPVYIISTDTLVENPVVAMWVKGLLEKMKVAAESSGLPFYPHRLMPELEDSFWVNLIGKGYPAPRPKFRWCTSRLKINPSNKFISNIIDSSGEAILALGMRKAESSMRAMTMKKIEKKLGKAQEFLIPNASLPNSYVYTPIEDWSNDDVWLYLLENNDTPWGSKNSELMEFYKGATKDRECPMAITTGTPSCGDSRFGCWVCTMVSQDRSMQAMIQNDEEKEWMLPLLEYRDHFNIKEDRERRDFRRINGRVQLYKDRPIHGPYWQEERKDLLQRLLEIQKLVKQKKPESVPDFEIITIDELNEIRKIWNQEKDEIEDYVPVIYEKVMGKPFPAPEFNEVSTFEIKELDILKEICGEDELHYQLVRGLISQEQKYRSMARRAGLFDALEQTITKHFYDNEEDAAQRELYFQDKKEKLKDKPEQLRLEPFVRFINN